MKRTKTLQNVAKRTADQFEKVFDAEGNRLRGLWQRKGTFYAQLCPSGQSQQFKYRLDDAQTIPQAITAAQVLKDKQRKGTLPAPRYLSAVAPENNTKQYTDGHVAKPRTVHDAIARYKEDRNLLGRYDPKSCKRQDGSLGWWDKHCGAIALTDVGNGTRIEYAKWRRTKAGGAVSGRTIDVDVGTMGVLMDYVVDTLKWLPASPFGKWSKLAKPPKRVKLLSHEQLHDFVAKSAVTESEMDAQRWPEEFRVTVRASNKQFADYIYTLAYSGAREQETCRQRWDNVDWKARKILFPGETAKKGAGRQAEDRWVDFNDRLEAHLKDMYERRDEESDWIFPNSDTGSHITTFRRQLERAREAFGEPGLGFHWFRHYFISYAMMAQPYVDVATIAYWVSHRDRGSLILKKYGHLRADHTQRMAGHVQFG